MAVLRAYLGPTYWSGGSFRPYGPLIHFGVHSNPWQTSKVTWTARFFVGFNVGGQPKYTMDDLIALVSRSHAPPDATYIAQHGVFTSPTTREVVQEEGAQVIIILGSAGATPVRVSTFEKKMGELAETICRAMQQEVVIVEIQRNGVVKQSLWVTQ